MQELPFPEVIYGPGPVFAPSLILFVSYSNSEPSSLTSGDLEEDAACSLVLGQAKGHRNNWSLNEYI